MPHRNRARPRAKKIILRILAGLFLAAGLWAANLCMYHYWASSFVSDPNRQAHAAWGNRFFCLAAILFGGFVYLLWLIRKKKNAV